MREDAWDRYFPKMDNWGKERSDICILDEDGYVIAAFHEEPPEGCCASTTHHTTEKAFNTMRIDLKSFFSKWTHETVGPSWPVYIGALSWNEYITEIIDRFRNYYDVKRGEMIFKNFLKKESTSLITRTNLKVGDTVILKYKDYPERKYKVASDHLSSLNEINDQIFTDIGHDIGQVNKHQICTDAYGYEAGKGMWPPANYNDMSALLRVIYKLNELYGVKYRIIPKEIHEFDVDNIKGDSALIGYDRGIQGCPVIEYKVQQGIIKPLASTYCQEEICLTIKPKHSFTI